MATLLSQSAWRRWTIASLLSRLPMSMALLAFVLAGQQSLDSAAKGSVLAGLMSFTAGLLGPWAGRRLDRTEVRKALPMAEEAAAHHHPPSIMSGSRRGSHPPAPSPA